MICGLLALSALAQMKAPVAPGHDLDFWIGKWKVYVGKDHVGDDKVTKSLNGFAICEEWNGTQPGDEGTSLFYYMPATKRWKQVWVTGVGVYKEKLSVPVAGGIRFSGTVFLPRGKSYQDRTTLTKLSNGDVHQVIESTTDGKAWSVGFDAVYKRA